MKNILLKHIIFFSSLLTIWSCTKDIEPIASSSGITITPTNDYKALTDVKFSAVANNSYSVKWEFYRNTQLIETTTELSPTRKFKDVGDYTVIFKAIGDGGSSGQRSTFTIKSEVDFTYTGGDCEAACEVIVSATTVFIAEIFEFEWNWGDQTPTTKTATLSAKHLYSKEGNYPISLIVRYRNGAIATIPSKSVTIKPTSLRVTNAWSAGSTLNDQGVKTATDKEGNVYVTGTYSSTITFGPNAAGISTTLNPTSGNTPLFIAKYSNTGVLIWVNNYERSPFIQAPYPTGIAISNNNTLYISYTNNNSSGVNLGAGILKFSTQAPGNLIWDKSFAERDTKIFGIALDNDENIVVGGYFNSLFDKIKYDNTGSVGFVMKYRSSGSNFWSGPRYFDSSISTFSQILKVAVAKDNSIFYVGEFNGNNTTTASTRRLVASPVSATGKYNTIIGKLDVNGNPLWTRQDGIGNTDKDYDSFPRSITTDNDNNLIILVRVFSNNNINFGTRTLMNRNTYSSGDTFLVKYKSDGTIDFLNYASEKNNVVWDICKDNETNILLAGNQSISKLDNSGKSIFEDRSLFSLFGSSGTISSITSDNNNNIFVTGSFSGQLTSSSGLTLNTKGGIDMFTLRFGK